MIIDIYARLFTDSFVKSVSVFEPVR